MSDITHGFKRAGSAQHQVVVSDLDQDHVVILTILLRSPAVYTVLVRAVTANRHLRL